MSKFLAHAAALALGASLSASAVADDAGAPVSQASATQFSAVYSGSVLIFQVADITVSGRVADESYSANARFRAAGLAALFTDADIEAEVSGYNGATGLRPWQYRHLNHASSKNRVIEINFPDGVAEPNINPPFGSMGEPPASTAQRTNAIDPLTGMFALATSFAGNDGAPCQGRIPVFDGKARYNLRLESHGTDRVRNRAFRGDALVCHAYYEPIAGYDPEDQPTERDIADPVVLWLAPYQDGSVYFPVRIRANAGFGGVTVEARSVEISTAP
tara:strand:+ start:2270 stop:3091 length:822 start_codon:yes stop_codon:yes gene_type:complete